MVINKIKSKSVLNKHKKRDSWFLEDYTLNPYLGCSFNCIYCYVNGSKYGQNISQGISVKTNAADVLYRQLKNRARKKEYGIIALGSATDPYMYQEKDLKMTRELLKIIYRFHFPLNLFTKSDLILRDMDLLKKIDKSSKLPHDLESSLGRGTIVTFSFSTMDLELGRIFEPCAPSPIKRLETMHKLKEEGFLVGACLMPLLPFISDTPDQLETMISKVKDYGGDFILTGGMTLFGDKPNDCRVKYYTALKKHFPEAFQKTKLIFDKSDYPPFDYQSKISKLASDICAKYNIRTSII
jgi:DNA repair photolyase